MIIKDIPITLVCTIVAALVTVSITLLGWYKLGRVRMMLSSELRFVNRSACNGGKSIAIRTGFFVKYHSGRQLYNLYVELQRGETSQTFPVMYIGDNQLVRRSGVHAGKRAEECLFHFFLPDEGRDYDFRPGKYIVKMFVSTDAHKTQRLFEQELLVTSEAVACAKRSGGDLVFKWLPRSKEYELSVVNRS